MDGGLKSCCSYISSLCLSPFRQSLPSTHQKTESIQQRSCLSRSMSQVSTSLCRYVFETLKSKHLPNSQPVFVSSKVFKLYWQLEKPNCRYGRRNKSPKLQLHCNFCQLLETHFKPDLLAVDRIRFVFCSVGKCTFSLLLLLSFSLFLNFPPNLNRAQCRHSVSLKSRGCILYNCCHTVNLGLKLNSF